MQVIPTLEYGRYLENIEKLTIDHALYIDDHFDQQYLNQLLKKELLVQFSVMVF